MNNPKWHTRRLGDVVELVNGRGFNPREWSNSGLPIIRIQNLNGNSQFHYYDGDYDPKIEVNYGDLLFAWSGSRGSSFGPHFWSGPKAVLNYHTWKIVPHGTDFEPRFLHAALVHLTARIEGQTHGFKTNFVHAKKCEVEEFFVPVPRLSEQKKIADILFSWYRAIELTEKLIAAKQKRKQALMQRLFNGNARLPRFRGQKWQFRKIAQILTESRVVGSDGENARKITVKLYGKGVLPKAEIRKGSSATQYYRRSAGQFIYSKLDFLNGAFGVIPPEMDGFESTLDLPAFDINKEIDCRWFLGFVSREEFYRRGFSLANGGRKARRVNPRDFLNIKIKVPSPLEQQAIADVLDAASRDIQLLQRRLDALKKQKNGLMQQLLTGKVRVKVDSKMAKG